MTKQDTQIAVLKEQMSMNTQEHNEIKQSLKDIKDAISGLDTKFSAKWVEKGITIIITAIVLGALYTVFKNNGINLIL